MIGLYNPGVLFDVLNKVSRETIICPKAIIMIDIDEFKLINDNLRHSTGDQVLIDFSHELLFLKTN